MEKHPEIDKKEVIKFSGIILNMLVKLYKNQIIKNLVNSQIYLKSIKKNVMTEYFKELKEFEGMVYKLVLLIRNTLDERVPMYNSQLYLSIKYFTNEIHAFWVAGVYKVLEQKPVEEII